ncbi:RAMP superfamily CRISPR-associated protein [Synechococcus sp. PCC 7336]|uniref:RAMP superfamily CRISPR-associated protein n=1 Tax=Synechococcus sp. PCC 7336 TaxID=195250 RepID=UPI0003461C41|nr:RAMP superfamily CRISPR-associated protein [Synechococcus sp. PCC 7336]
MYSKAYGVIHTEAPVHVGASAGEETGNLNLIFRDQFTQTGIIPGSSIRGRFRADMRGDNSAENQRNANNWYGRAATSDSKESSETSQEENKNFEALVKFEYASIVWLPIFCPGQPIVWVTCPRLLARYQRIRGLDRQLPKAYTAPKTLQGRQIGSGPSKQRVLFFNLGFLEIEHEADLSDWVPEGVDLPSDRLVVVDDNDIGMLHDMALYRQSRVKLADEQKKVEDGAFFNVEALPEGTVLVFPIALKETGWAPFGEKSEAELYFGGLESIGFGRCQVFLGGDL